MILSPQDSFIVRCIPTGNVWVIKDQDTLFPTFGKSLSLWLTSVQSGSLRRLTCLPVWTCSSGNGVESYYLWDLPTVSLVFHIGVQIWSKALHNLWPEESSQFFHGLQTLQYTMSIVNMWLTGFFHKSSGRLVSSRSPSCITSDTSLDNCLISSWIKRLSSRVNSRVICKELVPINCQKDKCDTHLGFP